MRRIEAWAARLAQYSGLKTKAEADAIVHSVRLETRKRRFQARLKVSMARRARSAVPAPRYDDVYFEGVAALDAMARGEIDDGLGVDL